MENGINYRDKIQISLKHWFLMGLSLSNASKWQRASKIFYARERSLKLRRVFCRTALQAAPGLFVYMDCFSSVVTWTPDHQEEFTLPQGLHYKQDPTTLTEENQDVKLG